MNNHPVSFASLEDIASFMKEIPLRELNDFIRYGHEVSYVDRGIRFTANAHIGENLLRFIRITQKNNDGVLIVDDGSNTEFWVSYLDFAKALSDDFPLKFDYAQGGRGFPRYGFATSQYAEFGFSWSFGWEDDDFDKYFDKPLLSFSIDDISIEISASSPIWCFLVGNMGNFASWIATTPYGFKSHLITIQFKGALPEDIERLVAQALFHIKTKFGEPIHGDIYEILEMGEFEERHPMTNEILYSDEEPIFQLKHEVEPFLLFRAAEDFMGYYRILEYFFLRARSAEIEKIRWSNKLSSIDFLSEIEKLYRRTELLSLEIVIKQITEDDVYGMAIEFGFIDEKNPMKLAQKIYDRRNKLVHAKESRDPFIPALFENDLPLSPIWDELMHKLAIQAINKYCI